MRKHQGKLKILKYLNFLKPANGQAGSYLLISLLKIPVIIVVVIAAISATTAWALLAAVAAITAATISATFPVAGLLLVASSTKVFAVLVASAGASIIIPVYTVICAVFYKRTIIKFQLAIGHTT